MRNHQAESLEADPLALKPEARQLQPVSDIPTPQMYNEEGVKQPPEITLLVDSARNPEIPEEERREAFKGLVQHTYSNVYTLAARMMADEHDALDVTQEVFLRAFKGIERFRGDAAFSTWMHRITVNVAINQLRKRTRQRRELGHGGFNASPPSHINGDGELEDLNPENNPLARTEAALLREKVEEALKYLPDKLRAVVVLRDIYDMNHEQIAKELGISVTNSKVRLNRARKKISEIVFPEKAEARDL